MKDKNDAIHGVIAFPRRLRKVLRSRPALCFQRLLESQSLLLESGKIGTASGSVLWQARLAALGRRLPKHLFPPSFKLSSEPHSDFQFYGKFARAAV